MLASCCHAQQIVNLPRKLAHFFLSLFSGIIYDVINEPPSIGSTTDERGHSKPVSQTAGGMHCQVKKCAGSLSMNGPAPVAM